MMTDKKTEQENKEEPGQPEQKSGQRQDPHRGTADTPSQHKGLDPDGERNNDEEEYEEDKEQEEEDDDVENNKSGQRDH